MFACGGCAHEVKVRVQLHAMCSRLLAVLRRLGALEHLTPTR
jgi:hypothetical protein